MIYEHRFYYILPGKLPEFLDAFAKTPLKVFARHGAKMVGFWTPVLGQSNEIIYILSFEDLAHRERVWAQIDSDPEMQQYRRESLEHPKVEKIMSKILRPSAFSPLP